MLNICVIHGHPDRSRRHLCHAIGDAYIDGARSAGAKVKRIDIAELDFPMMTRPEEFATPPPEQILLAQKLVAAADHLVIIYPLWLGTMPALVKAFFEQLCRNNFAITNNAKGGWPEQMLKGKSARVIVTMGMPAAAYRLMFGAHGVKGFESGILGMAGINPIRETLLGGIGELGRNKAEAILARARTLGQKLA